MPVVLAVGSEPLASVADLEAIMERSFTTAEEATAVMQLRLASAAIRNYTRQTISLVSDDTVVLRGTSARAFVLPERPVVGVSMVRIGTVAVSTASYQLVRDELWWGASALNVGNLVEGVGGWGNAASPVEVTYTHGYGVIPDDIQGVCLDIALRSMQNPDGATQVQVSMGPASVTQQFAESVPRLRTKLTEGEKETLNLYRRRVSCSSLST
jgi:hypothetical protein